MSTTSRKCSLTSSTVGGPPGLCLLVSGCVSISATLGRSSRVTARNRKLATLTWLTTQWQREAAAFNKRSLAETDYVSADSSPLNCIAQGFRSRRSPEENNWQRFAAGDLILSVPRSPTMLISPSCRSPRYMRLKQKDSGLAVLLCVKSQQTAVALTGIRDGFGEPTLVCLQNGVENERVAARFFPSVYGVCVMLPNVYLEPGLITGYSDSVPGVLDIGRYVGGSDERAERISEDFAAAGFASDVVNDISAVKYAKLITNLGNVVEALCTPAARKGPVADRAQAEGVACLERPGSGPILDRIGARLSVRATLPVSSGRAPRPGRASCEGPSRPRRTSSTARSACLDGPWVCRRR